MGTIHAGKRRRPFFFIFGAPPDYQQHRVLFDEQSLAVADEQVKTRGMFRLPQIFRMLGESKGPPAEIIFIFFH